MPGVSAPLSAGRTVLWDEARRAPTQVFGLDATERFCHIGTIFIIAIIASAIVLTSKEKLEELYGGATY
jgi:hypothetical protein